MKALLCVWETDVRIFQYCVESYDQAKYSQGWISAEKIHKKISRT